MKPNFIFRKKILFMLTVSFLTQISVAQQDTISTDDLLNLSFADLMNMEVTSVSKKAERLQDVPSSVYVISSDDINRSSAQNLMQLLRENVPGYWAVANDYMNMDAFLRSTNESTTLILLDGTPIMDNVAMDFDYENFEIPLAQIDRIEVIKGSGGTVYGANSATGVISIITKNASDQNKIIASADYGYPGKAEMNIIATPIKNDKISTTIYGKYKYFTGFPQMDEVTDATSIVPKHNGTGDTTIVNRFSGDDNKFTTTSIGLNLGYNVNEKLKLSTNINFSTYYNNRYYQTYLSDQSEFIYSGDPDNPKLYAPDSVFLSENKKNNLVANIRADYKLSDNHNLFFRASTNYKNETRRDGGKFRAKNSIIDFELQDNITLGLNQLSMGANYRFVNFNLYDFSENNQVLYVDPVNSENILGVFAQDKISLMDGKLNFILGLKAENYTLIDNKFYLSPMAKFSIIPNENITIWGGFTQSYTTPSYNQTNIEYSFFRAKSPDVFYNYTQPLVTQGVYQNVYDQARQGGANDTIATAMAQGFVTSPAGQYLIDSVTNDQIASKAGAFPGHFNVAAVNGENTKPTSFQNYEIGLKAKPISNLSIETNFFYTVITDAIGNSPKAMGYEPSKVHEGEFITPYYYGNYYKGSNIGIETVIKYIPTDVLSLEVSHSWFKYTREFQENNDFDIEELSDNQKDLVDEEFPTIPENVFRLKAYYTLNKSWKISMNTLYSTSFFTKKGTINPSYSYENQRFDPLFGDGGKQYIIGGQHDYRFVLNLKIEKYFMNNQLSIFAYGNDITNKGMVEGLNQFATAYPRQIGAMFGIGLTYNLQ